MNDIFNMILTTIKYKFAAISAKLRYWTNTSFLRAKFLSKFSEWLKGLFSVKPRHKADYYTIIGLLVSKKLVHAVVICVGLVCLGYLWMVRPLDTLEPGEVTAKDYNYDSFFLKFQNTTVNILAESGYVAYTGPVKFGYAQGEGCLYNESGKVVYTGTFDKNMYEGVGKLYYPSGQLQYEGDFSKNLYHGTGKLYLENGMLRYAGAFSEGYPEGVGELYNNTGNKVFAGVFQRGELLYTQLLGKTGAEIQTSYTGEEKIYSNNIETIVALADIHALYVLEDMENSIETEAKTEMIYVVNDSFVQGDETIESIEALKEELGIPLFEGNAYLNFYDAVAIKYGTDNGMEIPIETELQYQQLYEEYAEVTSFNKEALVYLYVYEINGLSYTFVTDGKEEGFFMYTIAK